jgi:hypothetical protein
MKSIVKSLVGKSSSLIALLIIFTILILFFKHFDIVKAQSSNITGYEILNVTDEDVEDGNFSRSFENATIENGNVTPVSLLE